MGVLQLHSHGLASLSVSSNIRHTTHTPKLLKFSKRSSFCRRQIRAVGTLPESEAEEAKVIDEDPSVKFAFVSVSIYLSIFLSAVCIIIINDCNNLNKLCCLCHSLCCFLMEHQTSIFVQLVVDRS